MRSFVKSIAAGAVLALLAAAPAAAYSTRYEVQHYPGFFTRTVNQSLGTTIESYGDGSSATLGFGTMPAPSLSIAATQTGSALFFIEDQYEFSIAVAPTTAAAQAVFATLGANSHVKIFEETGHITLTAPRGSTSSLSAQVGQSGGGPIFSVACAGGSGAGCGTTYFHTALFSDLATINPYACAVGPCPAPPAGTPITVGYDLSAIFSLNDAGKTASLLIDPTLTLDPDFLTTYGLSAADFTITPESGFGNSAPVGGVPEPAAWVLMVAGFGFVGAALRLRAIAAA